MRYYLIILLLVGFSTVRGQQNSRLSIIPEPYSIQQMEGSFKLNPKVIIIYNDQEAKEAAALLDEFLFSKYGFRLKLQTSTSPAQEIITIIHKPGADDESYTLGVQRTGIELSGNSAGLFYGIQTLQQLFPVYKTARISLPTVQIKDEPRFAYRGLMLDVSRHFFPVSYIKKFLDVMSQFKLNNFHWHLTDDQGWRIEIKKYPELQRVAAWREVTEMEQNSSQQKNGQYGGYYTQQEIKEVVAYAAARHINIIPEIEMPGHSNAALAAYPHLGCTGGPYKVMTSGGINKDVYCAGNDSVFTFLQGVIDEIVELFPGKYIHIGGDETPKDRWKVCQKCQARIKAEGLKDEHELQSYFVQRIEKYINSKGRTIIGWDEILEGGLAPNATVMSWRGETGGIEAARQRHEVIMSPYTYVYFDYYQGNPSTEPRAIGGFLPLASVYRYEPLSDLLTTVQSHYIKGLQANTWAEYIADEAHMDYMVYPRALAIAEIGWSPVAKKSYANFLQKLPARLAALDQQVFFRILEPFSLNDSVTTANNIAINLKPAVEGASVYYTTDGTVPTSKSTESVGPVNISLSDNVPVTLKTITILPSGRQSAVYAATYLKKPLLPAMPTPVLLPGISFKAVFENVKEAKTMSIQKADTSGLVNSFTLKHLSAKSEFGMTCEGYFLADEDGIYTFVVNADDGVALYLDDELTVDNDGQHPPIEKTGSVPLQKGYHKIRLHYFDAGGGKQLSVSSKKNGLLYPLSAKLFH